MLLVHQAGSVKVGELVRYTLTYTPSNDRILPTPTHLHLKVKNTSAIPLRAAWVHGPYTLHVCAYPESFNPHHKVEDPKRDGTPEYEPMVKAGGSWSAKLLVPDNIRETGADLGRRRSYQQGNTEADKNKGSVTWIIEVASQILFSNSASVGFEVLVGRDERSLELGFAAVAGHGHGGPADIKEIQGERERKEARRRGNVQHEGVYSKAVRLVVEDTETLWDKPALPSWNNEQDQDKKGRRSTDAGRKAEDFMTKDDKPKKRRKVHLVVLTHGLHSNLGADMLFLKESIDATVAQARADAKKRKEELKAKQPQAEPKDSISGESGEAASEQSAASDIKDKQDGGGGTHDTATAPLTGGQDDLDNAPDQDESDDEEETIVRGFNGNAVRTENGIQYLGKRLAKYILRFTYPDQPFLPVKRKFSRKVTDTFSSDPDKAKRDGKPSHHGSTIHRPGGEAWKADQLPYKFTSISFVGHSLGGLIQTYAIAYIQKHSPEFFHQIKPVNFIAMASPMLGLSNENPMYVKFALDFGLVGRTGQDLGLTWRPPTLATRGWQAMMNGFGAGPDQPDKPQQADPSAKPLLRVLPTGPAHQVLKMFRNRTVYSNVVNDGIVPLRTSCLLFLDWRGLGKVDKARRENGLIGTVAEWGWAELTGANASALNPNIQSERPWESEDDDNDATREGEGDAVPLPAEDEVTEDNRRLANRLSYDESDVSPASARNYSRDSSISGQASHDRSMLDTVMGWFRPSTPPKPYVPSKKTKKILRRGQTMDRSADFSDDEQSEDLQTTTNPTMRPHLHSSPSSTRKKRPVATRGDSLTKTEAGELMAPPKTSIFESAGDILHPPLPSKQWICDPSTRSRTIFHDRVYHPEDIPPPPTKRNSTRLGLSFSSDNIRQASQSSKDSKSSDQSSQSQDTITTNTSSGSAVQVVDRSGMKVEEKIARAYHRDLSWRKVLVRLEPDAHNNMIVRRMFANAYGWPVVKHVCDTHFADTHAARTRDEDEPARERAKPMDAPIDPLHGEEVAGQTAKRVKPRTQSETREARDELAGLNVPQDGVERTHSSATSHHSSTSRRTSRQESVVRDDSFFETSDGEDSDAVDERNLVAKILNPNHPITPQKMAQRPDSSQSSSKASPHSPTAITFTDGHRGLAPTSPKRPKTVTDATTGGSKATKSTFDSADVERRTPIVSTEGLVQEPDLMTPTSPTKMMGKGPGRSSS